MGQLGFSAFFPLLIFCLVIILILSGFRTFPPKTLKRKWGKIDYATAPLLGVLILAIGGFINQDILKRGLLGSDHIRPYSIIILFFSLAYICISLDLTGFFEYLSLKTVQKAGNSGRKLFISFYFLASGLTIFTSNDIVILTLTPIICYFAKYTKINPVPYLIAQFFAANIWSITLYIGNPTNIIVAEAYDLTFLEYSKWMVFPVLVAGLSALLLLLFVFRKQIPKTFEPPEINPESALKDKNGAYFGIICLLSCLILLTIAPFISLELWQICLVFAVLMICRDLIFDLRTKSKSPNNNEFTSNNVLKTKFRSAWLRMPWKIMPFIIGMFILIETLVDSGIVDIIAAAFSSVSTSLTGAVLFMIIISALACNLMNNQPMTILFTQILFSPSFTLEGSLKYGAMLALIMGSNFGANFTLIGALAGIMWHRILLDKEVRISFKEFAINGLKIMPFVVLLAGLALILEIWLFF